MEPDFNRRADALIAKGQFAKARALLEAAIREMPAGWKPCRDDGQFLSITFWDQDEFLAHADHQGKGLTKSIFWVLGSYSKAWYQLAVVAIEEKDFQRALFCIDCGIAIEPDHPELWCEKGYILGQLKRHEEALQCYIRAASLRDWAPDSYIARALRGQGVQLIDLDRLDEAEDVLRRSLELEPDNKVALNELDYIANLRQKREEAANEDLWFIRVFANPPQDPLTLRLLALVEDMPSIPGPQTVGPENYSRISDAFFKGGWEAFEEEFDRIVPRDRPDYADVKRDLLREPIFNRKVHRRMTETFTGKMSVEEMFEEIQRDKERKPH
jgi:tetratricopeptide (TPR) repeat protein